MQADGPLQPTARTGKRSPTGRARGPLPDPSPRTSTKSHSLQMPPGLPRWAPRDLWKAHPSEESRKCRRASQGCFSLLAFPTARKGQASWGASAVVAPPWPAAATSPQHRGEELRLRRAGLPADPTGDSSWRAAGSPHPQLPGKAVRTERGHGTWGMWRAPGGCRPAEEASAGRGLKLLLR